MSYEEKLEACRYLLEKREESLAWYVHMFGLYNLFDMLAHEEYLKKKAEFETKPKSLRDSKGRFTTTNNK